jgi:hypothetical protein
MLGDLIAQLDRPEVVEAVLATMSEPTRQTLAQRAAEVGMRLEDFAAGAVREFVERADDDLWFQLLTVMRKADDPGLAAVQTILRWVIEPRSPA